MLGYSFVVILVESVFDLLSLPHFQELRLQVRDSLAHQQVVIVDLLIHVKVVPVLHQEQRQVVLGSVMISPGDLVSFLQVPKANSRIGFIEYSYLVDDDHPNSDVNKQAAILISHSHGVSPCSKEEA